MNSKMTGQQKKILLSIFGIVVGGILLYFALLHQAAMIAFAKRVIRILMPFIYGGVLAYLMHPICDVFEAFIMRLFDRLKIKWKCKEKIASAVAMLGTYLFLALSILCFIYLVSAQLASNVVALSKAIPRYLVQVRDYILPLVEGTSLEDFIERKDLITMITKWLTGTLLPNADSIVNLVTNSVSGVIGFISNIIIGVIVSVYCLNNRKRFGLQGKKIVFALLPNDWAEEVLERVKFADKAFGGFISGKIVDSIVIGMIVFVFGMIINLPYYPLVGVIVGATNVIPFFGPFIGAIPSIFIILMESPMKAVYFLIFIIVLQQIDGNVISPRILSSSVGVNGFWVLFSILLFGGLFGVKGMIVGTPVFAVFYSIAKDIINSKLVKKNLPVEAFAYKDVNKLLGKEDKKVETLTKKEEKDSEE